MARISKSEPLIFDPIQTRMKTGVLPTDKNSHPCLPIPLPASAYKEHPAVRRATHAFDDLHGNISGCGHTKAAIPLYCA